MTIKTYLDRTNWPGASLCTGEPDLITWVDDTTKLPCAIIRTEAGHLCGYVGVPRGYKLDLDQLRVHGGITFNEHYHPFFMLSTHYVIGFDCDHSGDLRPSCILQTPQQYRNVGYVLTEVNNLVQQVHAQLNRLSV